MWTKNAVVQSIDAPTIYEVPILMQSQKLDVTILKKMGLPVGETPELGPWRAFLERRHKAEILNRCTSHWSANMTCRMLTNPFARPCHKPEPTMTVRYQ